MKKWYQSRTLWTNGLMAIGVVIYNATGQNFLSEEVQGAIIIIANVLLRVVTKEGLN